MTLDHQDVDEEISSCLFPRWPTKPHLPMSSLTDDAMAAAVAGRLALSLTVSLDWFAAQTLI